MAARIGRVFLSHTTELRRFPKDHSFVAAAEAAVHRAGGSVADMAYLTARDTRPSEYCRSEVAAADVFVCIVGFRYGTPVPDSPDHSYTELEFEAAGECGLPRLAFVLDEEAELPLPARHILDYQHGARQRAFRERLQAGAADLTAITVDSPMSLELKLLQALNELAAGEHARRADSAIAGASVAAPVGRLPVAVRGREKLLIELDARRGLVVLTGMGGVGKSTVAAALAARRQPDQVWWVPAGDRAQLAASLVTVARHVGADEADLEAIANQTNGGPDRFWSLLERADEGWLLVFDGADEPDRLVQRGARSADGTSWIRPSRRGLVLVTSRQSDPGQWDGRASIQRIGALDAESSARVLLDLAPRAGDEDQARALSVRLGGLPLALRAAGSSLASPFTDWPSFDSFQRALDRAPAAARLLAADPDVSGGDDRSAAVMETWEISLDQLASRDLPEARVLLRLLSCYAPAVPIPIRLLSSPSLSQLLGDVPVTAAESDQLDRRVGQTLRALARLGLIDQVGNGIVVHPVVSDANRAHLLAAGSEPASALVWRSAVRLLADAIGVLEPARPSDWPRFRQMAPHIQARLDDATPDLDDECLATLVETASRAMAAHDLSWARPVAEQLSTAARRPAERLGVKHPAVLVLDRHRAVRAGEEGRWEEAEVELARILATQRLRLGDDHSDTLTTRHEFVKIVAKSGRWRLAEEEFREILEMRRVTLGAHHPDTLVTRHELARVLAKIGRLTEAETQFEELLADERLVLTDDHLVTIGTRHELARALCDRGHLAEAEAAFEEVLGDQRRLLGDDHPHTLVTRHRLAMVIASQGRLDEAAEALGRLLQDDRRGLGDDHPDTLATRLELAALRARTEPLAGVRTEFDEIISAHSRLLGPQHPYTLRACHRLAVGLASAGQLTEARDLFGKVLDARRTLLGDDHPSTIATRRALEALAGARAPHLPEPTT